MTPVDENGHPLIVHVDTVDTWRAMEQLVDEGLVKTYGGTSTCARRLHAALLKTSAYDMCRVRYRIGVSNFSIEQMEALLPHCRIRPVVNQVCTAANALQQCPFTSNALMRLDWDV